MKRIILSGLATLALLTAPLSAASAADLAYKAPAPPPPPVCLWCGFYVGGSAGAGFGDKWWDGNNPTLTTLGFEILGGPGQSLGNTSLEGFLGGLQAGYNFQSGPMVFGVEGTWSWTNMNGKFPIATIFGLEAQEDGGGFNASSRLDWIATAVGRVGFTIDRAWIYAGGGAAWTQEKDSALFNVALVGESFEWDGSNTKVGWTFLTGIEYAIDAHWSARIQYNYYDFGTSNVTMTSSNPIVVAAGVGTLGISTDLRISTVTAGVNYRFNWDSPIAARY